MIRKLCTISDGSYEDWIASLSGETREYLCEKNRKLEKAASVKRKSGLDVGYGVLLVLNVNNGKVAVETESIAMNPYEDVWNTQPFLGKRKISAQQVRDRMDVVNCDA